MQFLYVFLSWPIASLIPSQMHSSLTGFKVILNTWRTKIISLNYALISTNTYIIVDE
jgi:hypothetical protein